MWRSEAAPRRSLIKWRFPYRIGVSLYWMAFRGAKKGSEYQVLCVRSLNVRKFNLEMRIPAQSWNRYRRIYRLTGCRGFNKSRLPAVYRRLFGHSGHSRLLNLQWPLITNVIETPAVVVQVLKKTKNCLVISLHTGEPRCDEVPIQGTGKLCSL